MNRLQSLVRETYDQCTRYVEPTARDCCDFIAEELAEVRRAGAHSGDIAMQGEYLRAHPLLQVEARELLYKEYGDLLFMVVELGNLLGIDIDYRMDTTSLKMIGRDRDASNS